MQYILFYTIQNKTFINRLFINSESKFQEDLINGYDLELCKISVTHNLGLPVAPFCGREEDLLKIRQVVESSEENHNLALIIHGMGGVGKTELLSMHQLRYNLNVFNQQILGKHH